MKRSSVLVALALLSQSACGGKAHSGAVPLGEAQGGASSGEAATSGAAGQAPISTFDDIFPWFDASGASKFPSGLDDEILQLVLDDIPARGTLSTHNVIDLVSTSRTVRFSARANAPFSLLVSAGHQMPSYDYFASRNAGMLWPVARVDVGLAWQDFSVPLADMQPAEAPWDNTIPHFYLAFIVEHPEPITVWFDEVWFE